MIKIICVTTHEGAETVADALYDFSKSGVSIEDREDVAELWNSTLVWDYLEDEVLNRPEQVTVTGFYDGDYSEISDDLEKRLNTIKENCPFALPLECRIEEVANEDWTEDWKRFYKIIEVGDLQVVPVWKKEEATGKEIVLINPGSAFGTGEHESTRLCLSLMQDLSLEGKNVIDTGCGSGILGIAALKMGAEDCLFRDIDESALNNLRENLSLNGVSGEVERASLLEDVGRTADIVLANITADILAKMENAAEVVRPGGALIMSGIIDRYAAGLIEKFEGLGFTLEEERHDGIWVGLSMRRK